MIQSTFYRHACQKPNTKTDQVFVLSSARESKSFVLVDSAPPEHTNCVHCGKAINTQNIINGLYDLDPVTNQYQWLYFLGIFGMPVVFKMLLHWPLIVAIFVGIIAGAMGAWMIIETIKSLSPKR